ncbi:unnamed protein product [Rotaria socialis]
MVKTRLVNTSGVKIVTLDPQRSKNCIRRRPRPPPPPPFPPSFGRLHLEPAADAVLLKIRAAQERLNFEIRRQYSLYEETLKKGQ